MRGIKKAGLASLAVLVLSGCEKTQWTHDEIADIAGRSVRDNSGQIHALELRVSELESKLDDQKKMADAISSDLTSTQTTLVANAKVANRNAARDMTRRGACGQEWAANEAGASYLRNKRCTESDLGPE